MAAYKRVLSPEVEMAATVERITPKKGVMTIPWGSIHAEPSPRYDIYHPVDLPEVLNSRVTLRFTGFTRETSKIIFKSWERQQGETEAGHSHSVLAEAKEYVRGVVARVGNLPCTTDDDWRRAFTVLGLCQGYCDTVLRDLDNDASPREEGLSASEGLLRAIDRSEWFLETLDSRIRARMNLGNTAGA